MQLEPRHKPAPREKAVGLVNVAIDENVLPRDKYVVHDEDRVVLVEAARQRIVERRAENRGALFVRDAADEFDPRRIGRDEKDHGVIFVLDRQ